MFQHFAAHTLVKDIGLWLAAWTLLVPFLNSGFILAELMLMAVDQKDRARKNL